MEGGPRRNSSLDMMSAAQISIPATRTTLQEAPMIGACLMNIQERKKSKKYLRKSCYHRIKCTAATFLAAFMWKRFLNSAALATTTHRKPENVSDRTSTQVRARMINKWKMKII